MARTRSASWALAGLGLATVVVATTIAFGQGLEPGVVRAGMVDRIGSGRLGVLSPDRNETIFPAIEVIRYPDRDNSIGRFDTRTGAIYRLRGGRGSTRGENKG